MKLKTAVVLLLFVTSISIAQNKVGTIDSDYIVTLMPELQIAMKTTQKYGLKLDSSFSIKVADFKIRVDAYKKREKEMGVLEKKTVQQELATLDKELQEYQKNANTLLGLRREELMRPLYKKLSDMVAIVSKENGYTQVLTLTGNQFAYFDANFDITELVLNKLGIVIPTESK
jgi:outer membrane protein